MFTIHSNTKSIDKASVQQLVNNSKYGSIFQTLEMFDFWQQTGIYEPFFFSVSNNNELLASISGVVIKEGKGLRSGLSKRAIIFGGLVIGTGSASGEALQSLLEHVVKALKKKTIYIETRNLNDYTKYKGIFEKAGWDYKPHLNFHLDCSNAELMQKRMSKSKLRQVRKSLRSGAQIVEAKSIEEVKSFYQILHNLYTTKVKTPLPSIVFFKKFFESGLGKYLLIKRDEEVIGGIMCPVFRNQVIYEWYVCGKDGQYKDIYPSILATWAAMDYASTHGIKLFDFMGAGSPEKDYGVREFKSKFGGELVEHGRFIKILNPFLYNIGTIGVKILKKVK